MLLCFSGALLLTIFVNGRLSREQNHILSIFTAILAFVATAFPMLTATAFGFSPAMSILYGIIGYHTFNRRWIAPLICAGSLGIYFAFGLAEQSHVFGLVIDKIRFGLVKPDDPTLLSYETRSNWIEDFNSPSARFLLYTVSFYLPMGLLGLIWTAIRAKVTRENCFIAAYGFIFLFFFVMSRRMITIEVIFLSLGIGSLLVVRHRIARR